VLKNWYHGVIKINSTATNATFSIYDSVTGTLIWQSTVLTNVPTGSNRQTGVGTVATHLGGLGVISMVDLDLMGWMPDRLFR
jgi:hypothetical protein